jgi:hypothetical protein
MDIEWKTAMRKLEEQIGRIELKGNSLQVKWAKQIRKKQLSEIAKMKAPEFALAMKPALDIERLKKIGCDKPANFNKLVWRVRVATLSNNDAKWWIEQRDQPAWKRIVEATKKCQDHESNLTRTARTLR